MGRLNQNQERWIRRTAFKQGYRNHRGRFFFGLNPLSGARKDLSDKTPDEIMGLPAGKSVAEVAKLAGARLIRTTAMPRRCSGVIGTCTRAARLAQLLPRQSHSCAWSRWWHKTVLAKTKVNPGWPPCAPPSTHD